ncbi:tRNA-splicing endonuclease subunit Sen34 [Passer montanus]|uniref:tRNA-splicing endonuclease subunit Sen34 n=1 Tax=Passer montanus TaxID=9160 RepID=UPI00195F5940|nr:tRNA-splicing endonuclease subunit Sen34 [Passer montanus]
MAEGPAGVPGVCGDGERSETPGTPPGSLPERPRVRRQRGRFLVWAPRAARALRERHPAPPPQVGGAEEREEPPPGGGGARAALATPPPGHAPSAERRFRVFRALWGRGLHLTRGGKFGGDFLVYPGEGRGLLRPLPLILLTPPLCSSDPSRGSQTPPLYC